MESESILMDYDDVYAPSYLDMVMVDKQTDDLFLAYSSSENV